VVILVVIWSDYRPPVDRSFLTVNCYRADYSTVYTHTQFFQSRYLLEECETLRKDKITFSLLKCYTKVDRSGEIWIKLWEKYGNFCTTTTTWKKWQWNRQKQV